MFGGEAIVPSSLQSFPSLSSLHIAPMPGSVSCLLFDSTAEIVYPHEGLPYSTSQPVHLSSLAQREGMISLETVRSKSGFLELIGGS